jgi:hypothetical protein
MKSKRKPPVHKNLILPPLFGLFVLGRGAEAQQQTVQPQMPPVESMSDLNMTNTFQVFGPNSSPPPPLPYEPFSWDQFILRPHADYQFIDAYGLLAAPGDHENTTIQEFSPGVLLNLGPHWALDYTATIGLYSNKHFGTEFDNAINLTGQTVYTDWIFGFQQSIVLANSPLIETGGQTSTQTYGTTVTGHHEDSEHVSEDLEVSQSIQDVSGGFENQRDWSTVDWLNYQPQSHFSFGIGPGLGYDNADFGPDSVFEQGQARLNWRATHKLSFQLTGGIQETEFLGGEGAGDLFSPIYGGTIQYQPFAQTQIALTANRFVSPSYFVGEYTEETSFGASLSQRFLGQFNFSISGSYNNEQFVASSTDLIATRTDKFYSLYVRLSHSFLQRGTAAIFYEYGSDDSSLEALNLATGNLEHPYSFASHQYGVEVSYSF